MSNVLKEKAFIILMINANCEIKNCQMNLVMNISNQSNVITTRLYHLIVIQVEDKMIVWFGRHTVENTHLEYNRLCKWLDPI